VVSERINGIRDHSKSEKEKGGFWHGGELDAKGKKASFFILKEREGEESIKKGSFSASY